MPLKTAVHVTELYEAVLSDDTDHDCVALAFRTDDGLEFTIEFAALPEGRFFNVCQYDETTTNIAITERLKVLASNTRLMLVDEGPSYVKLQTAEVNPRALFDQTEQITEALDANRLACIGVRERTIQGDFVDQLRERVGEVREHVDGLRAQVSVVWGLVRPLLPR